GDEAPTISSNIVVLSISSRSTIFPLNNSFFGDWIWGEAVSSAQRDPPACDASRCSEKAKTFELIGMYLLKNRGDLFSFSPLAWGVPSRAKLHHRKVWSETLLRPL